MAINNQIGNGDYPAALELLRRLCNRYDTEKDKVVRLRPEWFVERLGYMTSKHFNTKSTDDGYPRSVAKEYLMPTLVAKPDYMVLPRTLLELSLLCDNGKGCMILLSFLLLLGAHFDVHDAVAHSHLDKGLITQLSEYVKPALVRAKSFLGGDYSSAEWGNTTLGEAVIQLCLKSDAPSSLKQKFLDGASLAFRGIPMVPSSKCFVEPRFLRDREEKGKSAPVLEGYDFDGDYEWDPTSNDGMDLALRIVTETTAIYDADPDTVNIILQMIGSPFRLVGGQPMLDNALRNSPGRPSDMIVHVSKGEDGELYAVQYCRLLLNKFTGTGSGFVSVLFGDVYAKCLNAVEGDAQGAINAALGAILSRFKCITSNEAIAQMVGPPSNFLLDFEDAVGVKHEGKRLCEVLLGIYTGSGSGSVSVLFGDVYTACRDPETMDAQGAINAALGAILSRFKCITSNEAIAQMVGPPSNFLLDFEDAVGVKHEGKRLCEVLSGSYTGKGLGSVSVLFGDVYTACRDPETMDAQGAINAALGAILSRFKCITSNEAIAQMVGPPSHFLLDFEDAVGVKHEGKRLFEVLSGSYTGTGKGLGSVSVLFGDVYTACRDPETMDALAAINASLKKNNRGFTCTNTNKELVKLANQKGKAKKGPSMWKLDFQDKQGKKRKAELGLVLGGR